MKHGSINELMIRYVYILEIDNRGNKSRFFGHRKILYIGQTNNIIRRLKEHISGVNSIFINKNFKDARKIPVYIEYVYGTEYESIQRESEIKKMSTKKKRELILSDENCLLGYKPMQHIVLKEFNKNKEPYEQIVLYFNQVM